MTIGDCGQLTENKENPRAMLGFDRVTPEPDILAGKACIRRMRISVSLIVNPVSSGITVQEIVDEYPDLEMEDVQQALRYAA